MIYLRSTKQTEKDTAIPFAITFEEFQKQFYTLPITTTKVKEKVLYFRPADRDIDNVFCLMLDVDDGTTEERQEFIENTLNKYKCACYHSQSSTNDNPKYSLILPLYCSDSTLYSEILPQIKPEPLINILRIKGLDTSNVIKANTVKTMQPRFAYRNSKFPDLYVGCGSEIMLNIDDVREQAITEQSKYKKNTFDKKHITSCLNGFELNYKNINSIVGAIPTLLHKVNEGEDNVKYECSLLIKTLLSKIVTEAQAIEIVKNNVKPEYYERFMFHWNKHTTITFNIKLWEKNDVTYKYLNDIPNVIDDIIGNDIDKIITGPIGCGKTTLIDNLLKDRDDVAKLTSRKSLKTYNGENYKKNKINNIDWYSVQLTTIDVKKFLCDKKVIAGDEIHTWFDFDDKDNRKVIDTLHYIQKSEQLFIGMTATMNEKIKSMQNNCIKPFEVLDYWKDIEYREQKVNVHFVRCKNQNQKIRYMIDNHKQGTCDFVYSTNKNNIIKFQYCADKQGLNTASLFDFPFEHFFKRSKGKYLTPEQFLKMVEMDSNNESKPHRIDKDFILTTKKGNIGYDFNGSNLGKIYIDATSYHINAVDLSQLNGRPRFQTLNVYIMIDALFDDIEFLIKILKYIRSDKNFLEYKFNKKLSHNNIMYELLQFANWTNKTYNVSWEGNIIELSKDFLIDLKNIDSVDEIKYIFYNALFSNEYQIDTNNEHENELFKDFRKFLKDIDFKTKGTKTKVDRENKYILKWFIVNTLMTEESREWFRTVQGQTIPLDDLKQQLSYINPEYIEYLYTKEENLDFYKIMEIKNNVKIIKGGSLFRQLKPNYKGDAKGKANKKRIENAQQLLESYKDNPAGFKKNHPQWKRDLKNAEKTLRTASVTTCDNYSNIEQMKKIQYEQAARMMNELR